MRSTGALAGTGVACARLRVFTSLPAKFAKELSEAAFAPRASLDGKDAWSLAAELLSMSRPEFSAAFNGSPMKRAKLRGSKRNSSVVLGGSGAVADAPVLTDALEDPDALVRSHAASSLGRIGGAAGRGAVTAA